MLASIAIRVNAPIEQDTAARDMHADRTPDRYDALLALGLVTLAFITFAGALQNGFVNLDDDAYVTENPHVNTGLSPENLHWALTAVHSANWHPLTWLSHQLDCHLYGQHAAGHHATSLLLHAANAVLVFLFLRLSTGARWPGAIAAALFAVHPLRVESVAWIAERKDVLSAFFGLAAMCTYVRYARRPGYWLHTAVSVLFACSLLAKPMLVTLPCVLLLFDYWPLGRIHVAGGFRAFVGSTIRATLEKAPLFALAAAAAAATVLAQRSAGAVATLEVYPWPVRAGNAVLSYLGYVEALFWPVSLAVPYPLHPEAVTWARVAPAAALLGAISVLALWQWRRRPVLVVGWLWYLGTLVPVIGLVQVGSQAMADRYTYFTQIGLVWAIVWIVGGVSPGRKTGADCEYEHEKGGPRLVPAARVLISVAAISVCVVMSQGQVAVWRTSETLFRHALTVTRDNSIAHNNLGRSLLERYLDQRLAFESGEAGAAPPDEALLTEAITHFKTAFKISPANHQARNNFGVAMLLGNYIGAAIMQFERIENTPAADAAFYVNYAAALKLKGRVADAELMLRRALELEPGLPKALALLEQLQAAPVSP